MHLISMDLIDPSSSGYYYALTVICILTVYIFCIPLKTKTTSEVAQAYIDEVYANFGGSVTTGKNLKLIVHRCGYQIGCGMQSLFPTLPF